MISDSLVRPMRDLTASLQMKCLFAFLLVLPTSLLADDWEKLERCKLESNRYSDGDSFFVSHKGESYCFRLILCDTPETSDEFPERVQMQEKTFGVDEKDLFKIAKEATEFTQKALRRSFTVYTKWEDAAGQVDRYYAYVITRDGKDLTKELVRNGYSTAFGQHEEYFDGTPGNKLAAEVKKLEQEARKTKAGIWEFSTLPIEEPKEPTPADPKEPALQEGTLSAKDIEGIKEQLDEDATVSGEVSRVGATPTGSITFINFEGSNFTGVIFEANLKSIERDLGSTVGEALEGKAITLQGEISSYNEKLQIEITDSEQINFAPKAPESK